MKVLSIIFLFVVNFSFSQIEVKGKDMPGKWAQLKYDKIIAYKTKTTGVFVRGKVLVDSLIIKKVVLSKASADTLKSFLFNTSTYGQRRTYSNGGLKTGEYTFVFFSKENVVSYITVFLESNTILTNYKIPAREYVKIKVPKENYSVNGEGFSALGKKKMIDLLKSLGFSPISD